MTAWDDLLEEFRALGGTADNIRLGQGEYGRGLFPVDPTRPVAIHIPENLLVAIDDMVIQNGVPCVGPNAKVSERERAWLDSYQKDFAWGAGGADEIRKIFEMAGQLPDELRNKLLTQYRCGLWFKAPSDEAIAERYFNARKLDYRGRAILMPIVEMTNHGSGGNFDLTGGVGLKGSFSGEIVVEYSQYDSYDYFLAWGFATQRPVAFSIAVNGNIDSTPLDIDQMFEGTEPPPKMWIPKVQKTADKIKLPFLLIGHRNSPRIPKGIFYRLMRQAGLAGFEEAFDLIHHMNRLHFISLLIALDGIEVPMARTLRTMAHYQLRAMSFCYGVREV